MKKLAVLLIALTTLLTGCVVYDGPRRNGGGHHGDHDAGQGRGDRDRDGVPDRQDRRPSNPNRY